MNRNESSSVCPNRTEVEGARVSTPGVVEQVCQVEKEEKKGSECVARVAGGDEIYDNGSGGTSVALTG
jgi:hypothetical protein